MIRKTLVAAAAATILGISSFAAAVPAQATPLGHALHSKAGVDLSMVTEVGSKRNHWRKRHHGGYHKRHSGYHKRFRRRGPSVSFSFGLAPRVRIGTGFHPHFKVYTSAPRHCHTWRDRFGHRQRTCHRHY